jgi:DNA-binding transcriptional ArsR family regulator
MTNEKCLCKYIPQKKIDEIIKAMPAAESIEHLAVLFKLFGDPTRLRIIHILMHQELCVTDLASLIGMQQPAVSQQLKVLRLSRLVKYRKEGKTYYYTLDDEHVSEIFKVALLHLHE